MRGRIVLKDSKIEIGIKIMMFASVVIFFLLLSFAISKYVIHVEDIHQVESSQFYFESNIAEVGTGTVYTIYDWDGSEKIINFNVKNYLNELLKTNEEIIYNITAEVIGEGQNNINATIENQKVVENEKLDLSSNEKQYLLNIVAKDKEQLIPGTEYNVKLTISSVSPYKKELVANIKLVYHQMETNEFSLINSENGEYVTLNIKVNQPQDIIIKYNNNKLILDESNYIVNNVNITEVDGVSTFTISKDRLEKDNNYEIYFIKRQQEMIILGTDIEV